MSGEETVYYSSGHMLYNVVQGRLTVSGEETDLFGKRPFRAGCADLRRRRGTGSRALSLYPTLNARLWLANGLREAYAMMYTLCL